MKNILYFIIFLFSVGLSQEDNINLSGYVKSNSSGETLIGANVIVKELNVGCTTNNYGFFSLTLPLGSYTLETSYIGYKNVQIEISESNLNKISINSLYRVSSFKWRISGTKEEIKNSNRNIITENSKKMPQLKNRLVNLIEYCNEFKTT